jgi:hypothetical protein
MSIFQEKKQIKKTLDDAMKMALSGNKEKSEPVPSFVFTILKSVTEITAPMVDMELYNDLELLISEIDGVVCESVVPIPLFVLQKPLKEDYLKELCLNKLNKGLINSRKYRFVGGIWDTTLGPVAKGKLLRYAYSGQYIDILLKASILLPLKGNWVSSECAKLIKINTPSVNVAGYSFQEILA